MAISIFATPNKLPRIPRAEGAGGERWRHGALPHWGNLGHIPEPGTADVPAEPTSHCLLFPPSPSRFPPLHFISPPSSKIFSLPTADLEMYKYINIYGIMIHRGFFEEKFSAVSMRGRRGWS